MATKYAVASGNWSATSTWSDTDGGAPGAAVPVDNDTVVVCAGVTLTFNADTSGWANGVNGLTIRGGSTPGQFSFKNDADGTYHLKMKAGTTISGTTDTNRGRLLAAGGTWASPSQLEFGRKAIIELAGNTSVASINAENLDICLRCKEPTRRYVSIYYTKKTFTVDPATDIFTCTAHGIPDGTNVVFSSTGTLPAPLTVKHTAAVQVLTADTFKLKWNQSADSNNVDITDAGTGTHSVLIGSLSSQTTWQTVEDINSDACWSTASGHNQLCMWFNYWGVGSPPEDANLSSKSATQIVLSAGKLLYHGPQRAYLISRNVSIRVTAATVNQTLVNYGAGTHGGTFYCEFRGQATTRNCTAIGGGSGHTIGAVFWRLSVAYAAVASGTAHFDEALIVNGGSVVGATGASFTGHFTVVAYGNVTSWTAPSPATGFSEGEVSFVGSYSCYSSGNWLTVRDCYAADPFKLVPRGGRVVGEFWHSTISTGTGHLIAPTVFEVSSVVNGAAGLLVRLPAGTARASIYVESNYGTVIFPPGGTVDGIQYLIQSNANLDLNGSRVKFFKQINPGNACIAHVADGMLEKVGPTSFTLIVLPSTARIVMRRVGIVTNGEQLVSFSNFHSGKAILSGLFMYDVRDSGGNVMVGTTRQQSLGGSTVSVTSGWSGTPPVDRTYYHEMSPVEVTYYGRTERPICSAVFPYTARANERLLIKVDISKDTNGMTETPKAQIVLGNMKAPWTVLDEYPPKAEAAMDDNTDWQTLLLDYTPPQDEDLLLVVRCRNSSGKVWFNYRVEDITGRPHSLGLGI